MVLREDFKNAQLVKLVTIQLPQILVLQELLAAHILLLLKLLLLITPTLLTNVRNNGEVKPEIVLLKVSKLLGSDPTLPLLTILFQLSAQVLNSSELKWTKPVLVK
jgi:hypothetical protein